MKTITAQDLNERRQTSKPPVILDVRLRDDFESSHLPGALHACVYQVDFLQIVNALILEPATPVCLYGSSESSMESQMAAGKLERAGYREVYDFRGGIRAWREAGLPVEGDGQSSAQAPSVAEGLHDLDLTESRVEWLGRNLLNKHWGRIPLTRGFIDWREGRLAGGEFVLDMNGIRCDDLQDSKLNQVLVDHLRSDDFFDVERFSEARFQITQTAAVPEATMGGQNLDIAGELTLKGRTAPLSFKASAGITADGRVAAQALIVMDRTKWGVMYGSGKYFHRLAGHLVNDMIELQLRIVSAASTP